MTTHTTKITTAFLSLVMVLINSSMAFGDNKYKNASCVDKAVQRTIEIRSLPEKKYIHTIDGQDVLLSQFFQKCGMLFPMCSLYEKFYYWESEVKTIKSSTPSRQVVHKIRCYHNCISTYCPHKCDLRKKYGNVAEYYDGEGKFMGLAVYIGQGKYCTLPYDGYKK